MNVKHFITLFKVATEELAQLKKESMFINLLRGLHPLEAELMCLVKDKNLTNKYKITKDIVSKAYPDITWGGRS